MDDLLKKLIATADEHRQRFLMAGIDDPDYLFRMLGVTELIQPEIPGIALPTKSAKLIPVDYELVAPMVDGPHDDELREALMSEIAKWGEESVLVMLEAAGYDPVFLDSLTSNHSQES